jgi:hypothetical protein
MTTTATHTESAQIIDMATREGRLYHFNGGQAYIRYFSTDSNVLLIIDMTKETPEFTYHRDEFATNYFNNNHPQPTDRESLVPFYKKVDERKLSLVRNEG